ncbi:hypothetical protein NE236_36665 [Actinoallomurus purpureus]|uniref:hypothetical protein n=1 Tax=Actinoallomurus purpureus TaxID=478114 RepID=UPI00209317CD|nr:hypothetical protein [Actinoallomurus purpureus]MCO6010508.1 hypothetical protein [Actinoallomurus purpureus]
MNIKWTALGEVAVVAFAVGVAIVVIFAVGVLAWSVRPAAGADRRQAGTLATVAAGLCFLACALIVCYGIYLIVPQLH